MAGSLDWGEVIAACIAGVPAVGAWIRAELIHAKITTPSGDNIGHVVERTHDLAAVNALHLTGRTTPNTAGALTRLNHADNAPVQVAPEDLPDAYNEEETTDVE